MKNRHFFTIALGVAFAALPSSGWAGDNGKTPVVVDPTEEPFHIGPVYFQNEYAWDIVNWQQNVTEKPYQILRYSQDGVLLPNTLTVSGAFWGSWLHESSNTPGKFPILSRFPFQHGPTDTDSNRWLAHSAGLALTGRAGEWVTLFAQGEFSDIEFVGQDQYQIRKAIVMVGNLDEFPFYAYFGRNTVDFGSMEAYNPFTHTVNNHSFRIDSDDPVLALGFAPTFLDGFNFVATAIPGGRHLRVADTLPGDSSGLFENFALNASYRRELSDDTSIKFGGGWLDSSIYNGDVPHHPGAEFFAAQASQTTLVRNGAWDLFGEVKWKSLSVGGEFTTTAERWPATNHDVRSLTGQVAYDFNVFDKPSRLSFVYGTQTQGPDGEEYDNLQQVAVGLETRLHDNFSFGIEYVRNTAFVPLIGITNVSDGDVATDTWIIGGKFTF